MNIVSKILETCLSQPDRLAMIEDNRSIRYADLRLRALEFAALLEDQSIDQQPVAIALGRGIRASIAVLGVLCAGKCYLPLDLKNPPNRLKTIIQNARVSMVIGSGACPVWLSAPGKWIDIESLVDPPRSNTVHGETDKESLACILYTSGSTGQPKGIALSHRALHAFSNWAGETFCIASRDRIASLAPLHFDLSVFDLFTGLSYGACIHFVPEQLALAPSRLTAWLNEHLITAWYTVPSLLNFIALKGSLNTASMESLRTLLFAGEVMPTDTLIQLSQQLPETRFYNLFGPTETNVCCYWPVDKTALKANHPVPIGKAACQAELAVSDSTGELLVKGDSLFSGYWSDGQLINGIHPEHWYPTGDRVSVNPQGNFLYHGRIDRMLKCSGFRVEPAEIESVIRNIPIVEFCAVVGIQDPTSGQRPAAAVVLQQGKKLADLVPTIKSSLPAYMQPAKYLIMKQLPRLSNGKTDYLRIEDRLQVNVREH